MITNPPTTADKESSQPGAVVAGVVTALLLLILLATLGLYCYCKQKKSITICCCEIKLKEQKVKSQENFKNIYTFIN